MAKQQPKTPVFEWATHPDLVALQRLGDELRAKREQLERVGVPTRQALAAAQADGEEVELKFWADKATKTELQAAQKTLEDAQRANARNALTLREVERDLARVERDLPTVLIAAREEVARQIADIGEALLSRFVASLEQAASDWRDLQQMEQIATPQFRGDIQDDPAFPRAVGLPVNMVDSFYPVFGANGLLDQGRRAAEQFSANKAAYTTYQEPEVVQPMAYAYTSPPPVAASPGQLEPWASSDLINRVRGLLGTREQAAIDERLRESK